MSKTEMVARSLEALAEFKRLGPDEQIRRLVAAGAIEPHEVKQSAQQEAEKSKLQAK